MTNMGKAIGFCWILINVYIIFSLTWTEKVEKRPVMTCEECEKKQLDWCATLKQLHLKLLAEIKDDDSYLYNLKHQREILDIEIEQIECLRDMEDICEIECKTKYEEIAEQKRTIVNDFIKRHYKGD